MKLLVDMNLPPAWCELFRQQGWESRHWSEVGDSGASDRVIFEWASQNGCIVITHDLGFAAILANRGATGPSVVQVRSSDLLSTNVQNLVVEAVRQHSQALEDGALISLDPGRARIRVLPI